jgi:hypothetical protein
LRFPAKWKPVHERVQQKRQPVLRQDALQLDMARIPGG